MQEWCAHWLWLTNAHVEGLCSVVTRLVPRVVHHWMRCQGLDRNMQDLSVGALHMRSIFMLHGL